MVEDMDKTAASATTVPLFCQTYLGMIITSTSASRFLRLFNVFWNLLHVLDVSWPSGYWRTLSGDLFMGFSAYPADNHAQFLASFDDFCPTFSSWPFTGSL